MLITRRNFLGLLAGGVAGATGLAGYAFGYEPNRHPVITRYTLNPPGWRNGLRLRMVILADLHVSDPLMPIDRLESIIDTANSLDGDVHLLLGDYVNHKTDFWRAPASDMEVAKTLTRLKAPLGVHAIIGNHDWWGDDAAMEALAGPTKVHRALEAVGIPVLENTSTKLKKDDGSFWLSGLGSQVAFLPIFGRRSAHIGYDDLAKVVEQVAVDDDPVILLAHEPDIFDRVPERVSLTLSGHTHGGQVRFLGYSPVVPSAFGNRYAYGHIVENGRNLIVSGGLGCSILPVRFGVPPEIVVIDLGATE